MPDLKSNRHPGSSRLILHIGLPKTATTFLQHKIFRHTAGLNFVHRKQGSDEDALMTLIKRYQRVGEPKLAETLADVNEALAGVRHARQEEEAPGPTLISDESISLMPSEFWRGRSPDPARVAARLCAWASSERLPERSISVILGVRRQAEWLASVYTQSAHRYKGFDQEDFDRRMRGLHDEELQGCWQWLDYAETWRRLTSALGKESVFVAPRESLIVDPLGVLDRLGFFLGGAPLAEVYARRPRNEKANRRRVSENTWKFLKGDGTVTLSEPVGDVVQDRFKGSNQRLSDLIGVDLRLLGYW